MKSSLKKLLALALCAALCLALFSACGSTDSAAEASAAASGSEAPAAAEGGYADEQVLNILLGQVINRLDPNGSNWTSEYEVVTQTQAGLLRILTDDAGNDVYELDGAESYTVSEDGLTYTFKLRDNNWSDGQPVTAEQYVYGFFINLNPENGFSTTEFFDVANAEAYYNGECAAEDVGIKAIDDHTVEYTLAHPNAQFLYYLAYRSGFPTRQDVVEAATSDYGTNIDEMVFCGPFKITSWVKENSITLEKNESYWDADSVTLQKVNMQYVGEQATQATLFDAQQLDIVPYNDDYGADWIAKSETGEINYVNQTGSSTYFFVFAIENGGTSGLMDNANIRKALSLSIDRQELVDTIWGRYAPAYTYVPPVVPVGTSSYNTSGEGLVKDQLAEYATDESLQELFKQGLEEEGQSTDLSTVDIHFVVEAANVARQTEAEYIAQVWESRLGIKVTVDVTTDAEERQQQMDYDVSINSWEGGASPYDYVFVVNVPYGLKYLTGVYTNEHVNELLEKVVTVADEAEQVSLYHEIEDTILDEAGVGPLYYTDNKYFVQTYVEGVRYTTFGPVYDFSRAKILAH